MSIRRTEGLVLSLRDMIVFVIAQESMHGANTVDSSFALVKRGLIGIYRNVSKEHLHRYIWQFDFIWNNRSMNDGERISAVTKSAEGRRLMYRPSAEVELLKSIDIW